MGSQGKSTHGEIIYGGISSKCLYKEINYQTAENTNNCLNKDRINYQNNRTMVQQANTNINKEYVTRDRRGLK